MKSVLLTAVVGAILGAIGLTWLYMALTSPESVREAGIGWGVMIFMVIAPINAVLGAYFGLAIGLTRLALKNSNRKKAGWVSLIFGGVVVGLYLSLYVLTGIPAPAGMHHTSALTTEPSTRSQDIRDGLSCCSPLLIAIFMLVYGASKFGARFDERKIKQPEHASH